MQVNDPVGTFEDDKDEDDSVQVQTKKTDIEKVTDKPGAVREW